MTFNKDGELSSVSLRSRDEGNGNSKLFGIERHKIKNEMVEIRDYSQGTKPEMTYEEDHQGNHIISINRNGYETDKIIVPDKVDVESIMDDISYHKLLDDPSSQDLSIDDGALALPAFERFGIRWDIIDDKR